MGIRAFVPVVAAVALLAPAGAGAHAPGFVFSAFGTPTMDGTVGSAEWASASSLPFQAAVPGGDTIAGELRVMNDATNLYFGVRLATTSPLTAVTFSFDNDHSPSASTKTRSA